MSGGVAAPTGIIARLSGLISVKMLAGMFIGVVLVMGAALWKTGRERDVAQGQVRDIGSAVAQIAGVDPSKLKPGQLVATIKVIGTDRDTARRERDNFKATATSQTKQVRALGAETARLKAQSNAAVAQVRVVTQQRDRWIATAKAASERTTRLPDNTELKQMEEALDALYRSGF